MPWNFLQLTQWHKTAPLACPETLNWMPLQRHDALIVCCDMVGGFLVLVNGVWKMDRANGITYVFLVVLSWDTDWECCLAASLIASAQR